MKSERDNDLTTIKMIQRVNEASSRFENEEKSFITLIPEQPTFITEDDVSVLDKPNFFSDNNTTDSTPDVEISTQQEEVISPVEKLPFESTVKFLIESLEGGSAIAFETLPQQTQAMLKRGLFILRQYYGLGKNGHEIAKEMNITPSIVYQIKNKTIRELWKNSDLSIKERYPIDLLRLEKPRTVELDMKISRSKGGRATKIAELAQQGYSSTEICEELGINIETLNKYRHILKRWGIDVPYVNEGFELKKIIQETIKKGQLNDLTAERLLSKVPLSLYENNHKGDNALFTSIKELAIKAGFRYSGNIAYKFYEELERAGIPLGKVTREVKSGNQKPQTYVFILSVHVQRAIRTLQAFPELDKYRVLD